MNNAWSQQAKVLFSVVTLASTSAFAADEAFKVSGFVDSQIGYNKTVHSVGFGTSIADGAVYLSKALGSGMAMVDLPFSLNSSTSSNIDWAQGKGQAFVSFNYGSGLSWRLGQFDGIFGLERNDSKEIRFTQRGSLYGSQPVVMDALMVGYEISKILNVSIYAGAQDSTGTFASGKEAQYGAKISYDDAIRLSVGGYMQKLTSSTTRTYVNAVVGTKVSGVNLDGEFSMKKDGDGDAGTGFGLIAGYDMNDSLSVGARGQMMSKLGSFNSTTEVTVGPQFQMTKDLRTKVDYTFGSDKLLSTSDARSRHALNVAAVYSF